MRRARHRAVRIAARDTEFADQVGLEAVMHDWTARAQRHLGVDDGRQFLKIERNELGRVLCFLARLRRDDRDGLADMPDLVVREQRL